MRAVYAELPKSAYAGAHDALPPSPQIRQVGCMPLQLIHRRTGESELVLFASGFLIGESIEDSIVKVYVACPVDTVDNSTIFYSRAQ